MVLPFLVSKARQARPILQKSSNSPIIDTPNNASCQIRPADRPPNPHLQPEKCTTRRSDERLDNAARYGRERPCALIKERGAERRAAYRSAGRSPRPPGTGRPVNPADCPSGPGWTRAIRAITGILNDGARAPALSVSRGLRTA